MLFEVRVKKFFQMAPVQLPVGSESLAQFNYLMSAHVINVILHFGRPEVYAELGALVRLIVCPEASKGDSSCHHVATCRSIVLFKLLKDARIKDASLGHVIEHIGHLLQRHIVVISIVQVVNILKYRTKNRVINLRHTSKGMSTFYSS